jgi:hypothetical protein
MELCYRGISYESEPSFVETKEAEVAGKYRGLDWRFRNLKKAPILLPTTNLTYRGVTYHKPGTITTETTVSTPVVVGSTAAKARVLMVGHTRNIKKRQLSMLNRAASAIGLDGSISQYWNRIQGKIHPSFRASYDRYGSAMS